MVAYHPELRVKFDYVLPHKPREHWCRLCNGQRKTEPPKQIRIRFRQGWTNIIEVCDACYTIAVEKQNTAGVIPHLSDGPDRASREVAP